MHRGVEQLVRWVFANRDRPGVAVHAPASTTDLMALEAQLGVPLPTDLRLVLTRFNGGTLPTGTLLQAGTGPGTIEGALRRFAEQLDADFLDTELYLPFHRTTEGSWLCFDRSAGPLSDTWPIVDYFDDTGDVRLMFRTFDGWCRVCVAEWEAEDPDADFTLDKYLRQGRRHASIESDVSTAHATVAHACRRAGEPELALDSYLRAARCVPALPYCDWEALKLAVLLDRPADALEAATRLCAPAPPARWAQREATPSQAADVLARVAAGAADRSPWTRLLDLLESQAEEEPERAQIRAVRKAIVQGEPLPLPLPARPQPVVPPMDDARARWAAVAQAYAEGRLRDDDFLLDPTLRPLRAHGDFAELLRIRREF